MCLLALLRRLRLGLLPAGIISTFFIIQYGVMTGLQTSTFRALVMFLLGVAALCIGRTYDMLSAMSLAAILLLLENPLYLYHTGFLLSFGAIMGIGLVNPCILYLIPKAYRRNKVVQSVCVSLSVQLATLPVILNSYYQVSVCGILLNLIVVPLMTFVLALGIVGGVAGLWFELPGFLLLLPCRWILVLYEWMSELATKVPGSVWITGKPEMWQAVVYYILLFAFLVVMSCIRTKYKYKKCDCIRQLRICGIIVMSTITILLTSRWEEPFTVTMLSVGQGECTVIHGRDIPTVMIDGGSTDVQEVGKYRMLPYLKANRLHRIDTAFISHTDTDHIRGVLEILQTPESGVHINRLILPAISTEQQNEHYQELVTAATAAGTKVYTMGVGEKVGVSNAGQKSELLSVGWFTGQASGAKPLEFVCLHPQPEAFSGDINENSMVLLMSYVNFKMLFTGDISSSTEAYLLEELSDCDILKTPHHGSRFSSSEAFLQTVNPELALISAGRNNSYGHPHQETLDRMQAQGIRYLRTDQCGAIEVSIDEDKARIKTFLVQDE